VDHVADILRVRPAGRAASHQLYVAPATPQYAFDDEPPEPSPPAAGGPLGAQQQLDFSGRFEAGAAAY
jgi:hypothetical protein